MVRVSLWVPCWTNLRLIKVILVASTLTYLPSPEVASTMTYLPSLEVASSKNSTACIKRSAPSLVHINTCLFIWHMKLDLVDQSNIDGCIHLKGTKMIIVFYLKFICLMLMNDDLVLIKIFRFMGEILNKQWKIKPGLEDPFACLAYIVRQLIFVLIISTTLCCCRVMLGIKLQLKLKGIHQCYQCLTSKVILLGKSYFNG